MSNAKQEQQTVNTAGLLRDVQAMCLLYERDGIFSKRDVRATLKTIYPWLPIEDLPEAFPIPAFVGDESSQDYKPIALAELEDAE